MTRATRTISITYGGLKIGEGTSYDLHGPHTFEEGYEDLTLEADVIFRAASASALDVLDAAFRAAYSQPDSDITLTVGGTNFLALTHAGNTGFNARSSIKTLDRFRTDVSKAYRLRIVVGLPADLAGRNARRDSTVTVTTDPANFLTLFVTATYTASGVNSAYAQAVAQFDTYVDAIKTALGGTWVESAAQRIRYDDQNKIAFCEVGYRQGLINESGAGADDTALEVQDYQLTVLRPEERVHSGSGARPLTRVTVSYDVVVVSGTNVGTAYETKIRPYLRTLVSSHGSVKGQPRLVAESPNLNPWSNRVTGSATFLVAETSLLVARRRIGGRESSGLVRVPVLDAEKPYAKDDHVGPQSKFRFVEIYALAIDDGGKAFDALLAGVLSDDGSYKLESGYKLLDLEWPPSERFELNGPTGDSVRLREDVAVLTFEYGEPRRETPTRRRPITQPGFQGSA